MDFPENRFSFLNRKPTAMRFAQQQVILNDAWVVNLMNSESIRSQQLKSAEDLLIRKLMLESPSYIAPEMQIRKPKEKPMFNEIALEFIKETAEKDMRVVDTRINQIVDQLTYNGKQLSDAKAVKAKLISILQSYDDKKEDDKPRQSRCC